MGWMSSIRSILLGVALASLPSCKKVINNYYDVPSKPKESKVVTYCDQSLENRCQEESNVPVPRNIAGTPISSGRTDQEGKATFVEGLEEVNVFVTDKENKPITNVSILYFNLQGAEVFSLERSGYQPQVEIASHNSNHHYQLSLTPAPLQALYFDKAERERNARAANTFVTFSQQSKGWHYIDCWGKEEVKLRAQGSVMIVKTLSKIFGVPLSPEKVDESSEYILNKVSEGTVMDVYLFRPVEHGMIGTSAIWTMEARSGVCPTTTTCRSEERFCLDNKVYERDSCSVTRLIQECLDSQKCENAICVDVSLPVCDVAEGCQEQSCVFYQRFDGSSLDTMCRWNAPTGAYSVAGDIITLASRNGVATSISSKAVVPIRQFDISFNLATNAPFEFVWGAGHESIKYDGSNVYFKCGTSQVGMPHRIDGQWHTTQLTQQADGTVALRHDAQLIHPNLSCSGQDVRAGPLQMTCYPGTNSTSVCSVGIITVKNN